MSKFKITLIALLIAVTSTFAAKKSYLWIDKSCPQYSLLDSLHSEAKDKNNIPIVQFKSMLKFLEIALQEAPQEQKRIVFKAYRKTLNNMAIYEAKKRYNKNSK